MLKQIESSAETAIDKQALDGKMFIETDVRIAPTERPALQEIRHSCHRLLIVVRHNGIELVCPKCSAKVLYSWRQLLTMMLLAQSEA